jgi:hypothetical protein
MDGDRAIRRVIAESLKAANKSRAEIAENLTRLLFGENSDRHISRRMLEDFASPSKALRFPAGWIEGFCLATNDDRLQRLVMGHRLRALVRLAEDNLDVLRRELAKEPKRGSASIAARKRKRQRRVSL